MTAIAIAVTVSPMAVDDLDPHNGEAIFIMPIK
jgi:hypothetical protein